MKKILLIAAGLLVCTFSAQNASAATSTWTQTKAGDPVKITATSVSGAQDIEFNPSTNVKILGASGPGAFGVGGWHTQAELKASGQAYAMMSDSNQMYFRDISKDGDGVPTSTDVTSKVADYTTAKGWNAMYFSSSFSKSSSISLLYISEALIRSSF